MEINDCSFCIPGTAGMTRVGLRAANFVESVFNNTAEIRSYCSRILASRRCLKQMLGKSKDTNVPLDLPFLMRS
jgi:hypothetical protein